MTTSVYAIAHMHMGTPGWHATVEAETRKVQAMREEDMADAMERGDRLRGVWFTDENCVQTAAATERAEAFQALVAREKAEEAAMLRAREKLAEAVRALAGVTM